ncbi:MAG: hypothetical protein ABW196_12645 [Solirubrobacterales bacterium]
MNSRRAALALAIAVLGTLWAPGAAMGAFGIDDAGIRFAGAGGEAAMGAGSHPFETTVELKMNSVVTGPTKLPDGAVEDLTIELPPGFAGNPQAVPRCSNAAFIDIFNGLPLCPNSTALGVGAIQIDFSPLPADLDPWLHVPIYNLAPPPGKAAKLGFVVLNVPVTVDVGVSSNPPYNVVAYTTNIPQFAHFFGSEVAFWGNPVDPAHDPYRGACVDVFAVSLAPGEPVSTGLCPVETEPKAFITLPRSCTGPLEMRFDAQAWNSGETDSFTSTTAPLETIGCGKLDYGPRISSRPTTASAETGSGLEFEADFEEEGLSNPNGLAASDTKKAVISLPEGVTVNPSVGEGLGACAPADLARETATSKPGEGCPNASKIGTLHVVSPLVEEGIDGAIFLARQDDPATTAKGAENPFDSLIALYFVLQNRDLGLSVKLPVKVEPDPVSGQLVTTLDDAPQFPLTYFRANLRTGARAALVTPGACGTYATEAKLYPWANPTRPFTTSASFEVTSGVGGGPCPAAGVPPFKPRFEAGSINNDAGSFSPFSMGLLRADGEQDMTKFSSILPPGQLGSLAGVGKCPDAAVDIAKSKTGRQEIASPSCPASSQIGRTVAGAGVGEALTYVGGQIYLAGPYQGAPLSVIAITPAVAGPFDAGTVAVRLGLDLNPKTAQVEVDGAASDPIPHILKGIVLKLRDLQVYVDRPNFTLNPTSCDESSVKATLFGSYLDVFNPADDVPVDLATRYQAANCASLGFKPKLDFKLKGGTKRGGHPGLTATYTPRKGDANVKGLVVRLPRSAFLDQGHIRTICTRVQFAADACPKGAQYGFIKAFTPLLDEPLAGPVYLRSSSHKLPDLVFDLHGLVDVEVATRIDSFKGGIRAKVESAPDAPLSKVVLQMQGAKKGLIVNSRNLCGTTARADVQISAHNGKEHSVKPVMRAVGCGKGER